jgi:hypothetical protein
MSKRYLSDKSGVEVPERECSILKINKRSPLYERFGPELHLNAAEARSLGDWVDPPADGKPRKAPKSK